MTNSILNSVKLMLGIDPDYTAFDPDITMQINTAINTLTQLGVGPSTGFMIESKAEEWDEFTDGNVNLNMIKTFVGMSVRLAFDPPSTAHAITAIKGQIEQLGWRINIEMEGQKWLVTPVSPQT